MSEGYRMSTPVYETNTQYKQPLPTNVTLKSGNLEQSNATLMGTEKQDNELRPTYLHNEQQARIHTQQIETKHSEQIHQKKVQTQRKQMPHTISSDTDPYPRNDRWKGYEPNPKSKRITTNNQWKSYRVSSDGSRDTDTNTSMKDKMDQTCISKNTVENEKQQPINQPILVTSDNTESRHTNINTDGNIKDSYKQNSEQSFLDRGY